MIKDKLEQLVQSAKDYFVFNCDYIDPDGHQLVSFRQIKEEDPDARQLKIDKAIAWLRGRSKYILDNEFTPDWGHYSKTTQVVDVVATHRAYLADAGIEYEDYMRLRKCAVPHLVEFEKHTMGINK